MNIAGSYSRFSRFAVCACSALLSLSACSAAVPKNSAPSGSAVNPATSVNSSNSAQTTIDIQTGGPADTVRAFYLDLREKRFREAIFLTNLRPAIEGLNASELNDFAVDFEALAGDVPADLEINGEIISGDRATVTAKFPNADGDKKELQQIKLKKDGQIWIIQTVDEAAEARIKKEGKQYFYNLRIETHENEAHKMLDRLSKAEMAYALQNGGAYADIDALVQAGLLPDDIKTSDSTGYSYALTLSGEKKTYSATATPAEYGKSGKLSFMLALDPKSGWRITSRDNSGKSVAK